jgi:hypothetical protein
VIASFVDIGVSVDHPYVGNKGAVPITRLNISGIPKLMLYFTDSD